MACNDEVLYFWKYVQRKQRDQCVKDVAETSFRPSDNRVIVVDELEASRGLRHAEELLSLCYCSEVAKIIQRLSCELCFGCMFEREGERDHTCRLTEGERVDKYFAMAMNDVRDHDVLDRWMNILDDTLKNSFNLIPYQCKAYRDSQFKTSDWREQLKQRTLKMLLLEKRLS